MQDRLSYTLGLVNEWLRFAETKNAALLAVDAGAVLALIKIAQGIDWNTPVGIWIFTTILLLLFSCVLAMISFLPDVVPKWKSPKKCPREDANLLFYGDLAYYDRLSLLEAIAEQECASVPNNSAVLEDYAEQIITNSRIALRKYKFFRLGMWIAVAGVVAPMIVAVLFVVFTCFLGDKL